MERDAARAFLPALLNAIVLLVMGWFFLFPAVCRSFPLQVPGTGFDICIFFRQQPQAGAAADPEGAR